MDNSEEFEYSNDIEVFVDECIKAYQDDLKIANMLKIKLHITFSQALELADKYRTQNTLESIEIHLAQILAISKPPEDDEGWKK